MMDNKYFEQMVGEIREFMWGDNNGAISLGKLKRKIKRIYLDGKRDGVFDKANKDIEIVGNDAFAATFQTVGQYRTALIKNIATTAAAAIKEEA